MLASSASAAFAPYRDYLAELQELALAPEPTSLQAHLDGVAYQRLRQTVSIEARREAGTFFTSSRTRSLLMDPHRLRIARGATVLDPACGAGDLLIEAALSLPKRLTTCDRLARISRQFVGYELVSVLADVARIRLTLSALGQESRRKLESLPDDINIERAIVAGDGLGPRVNYRSAKIIALNPPYARIPLPEKQSWGEGLHTAAAPFTLSAISRATPGAYISAILPDVLRSGPRYDRWRQEVEQQAKLLQILPLGLFDEWTDVDVFILHLQRRSFTKSHSQSTSFGRWTVSDSAEPAVMRLGALAEISIGDVVPHRHDENDGPEVPYLQISSAPVGETVKSSGTRRFSGRLHSAPFIAVRRTSAPTRGRGGSRILGTIIHEDIGDVAVENHLIVIKPRTPGLRECEQLLAQLAAPATTAWLDKHVGTRHLTKAALLELPMPAPA